MSSVHRRVAVVRRALADPLLASASSVSAPRSGPRIARPSPVARRKRWTRRAASISIPTRPSRSTSSLRPEVSVALERRADRLERPLLGPRIEPELPQPPPRVRREPGVEQRQHPPDVLGREQVHRAAHRPRPDDRALLGARPVDVRGAKARASSPEAQAARAQVLGLDARRSAGRRLSHAGSCGAVQELRRGAERAAGAPCRPRGSGQLELRVRDRLERAPVKVGRAVLDDRRAVLGRGVADVAGESELRVGAVDAAHVAIAGHLRDHRRRGDRSARRVAVDDGAVLDLARRDPESRP